MNEREKAERVLDVLNSAEMAGAPEALAHLNGLIGLLRNDTAEQSLELDEARSATFLAICEVGKALHRGAPADRLWAEAIAATRRWRTLAG